MNNTKSVEIGGLTYTFGLMPPTTGVVLQTKLLKILAPIMALFTEVEKGKDDETVDIAVKAISVAFANLTEADIGFILRNLEDFTTIGAQRCSINEHFLGKTLTLYKALFAFLRFNFADFFELIPSGLDIKSVLAGRMSKFQKIQSIGISGDRV